MVFLKELLGYVCYILISQTFFVQIFCNFSYIFPFADRFGSLYIHGAALLPFLNWHNLNHGHGRANKSSSSRQINPIYIFTLFQINVSRYLNFYEVETNFIILEWYGQKILLCFKYRTKISVTQDLEKPIAHLHLSWCAIENFISG